MIGVANMVISETQYHLRFIKTKALIKIVIILIIKNNLMPSFLLIYIGTFI